MCECVCVWVCVCVFVCVCSVLFKDMRTFWKELYKAWHPYTIKHEIALENSQRRATKELPGTMGLIYICIEKMNYLNHQHIKGIPDRSLQNNTQYLWSRMCTKSFEKQWTGNSEHSPKSQTKPKKNVFPIRVTEPWSSLPDTVVTANSLESSKTRLDKCWYTQDIVYDFEAPLRNNN